MDIEVLYWIGAGVAAVFLTMSGAIGTLWARIVTKDKTIGNLVKAHQREIRAMAQELKQVRDEYVALLKEMAAALDEEADNDSAA